MVRGEVESQQPDEPADCWDKNRQVVVDFLLPVAQRLQERLMHVLDRLLAFRCEFVRHGLVSLPQSRGRKDHFDYRVLPA